MFLAFILHSLCSNGELLDSLLCLKKPGQAPRGVPVGPKVGFKPVKQVSRHFSNSNNVNTSGNKKKDLEPTIELFIKWCTGHGDLSSVSTLRTVLDEFRSSFELHPSMAKSTLPIRYLGVPIVSKRLPSNVISWGPHFCFVAEKSSSSTQFFNEGIFKTYPPLDDCQLWETLGSTISVSMKDMNTSLWNWNSTYGFYQYCPMASIVSYSLVICASAWYLNNGSIEYHENSFLIIYSLDTVNETYPPLDDCQLWETLGSTISVSMKDMNTSLWNWNSTYGFYQYCPMAFIVSYSLVICASAWYLNNDSIEYHENSFLIIYSLGKFFKGAHSFGLASCCIPCVSNVSSLWLPSNVISWGPLMQIRSTSEST
ncbi:hypothetical protein Tco_0638492 [Tanacetum coccineum]